MITIALAMALAPAAASEAACGSEPKAVFAWLSLVDAKRWDESWTSAGSLFRSRMSEANWPSAIQPVRDPLGPVSSRSMLNVTNATSLPGTPDGNYQVVQFKTTFANKKDATETVILACEPLGWKVDGYFIH